MTGQAPARRWVSWVCLLVLAVSGCTSVPGVEVPYVQTPHEVVAAMLGLAAEELLPAELDAEDPHYPVLVTAACRKLAA